MSQALCRGHTVVDTELHNFGPKPCMWCLSGLEYRQHREQRSPQLPVLEPPMSHNPHLELWDQALVVATAPVAVNNGQIMVSIVLVIGTYTIEPIITKYWKGPMIIINHHWAAGFALWHLKVMHFGQ